MYRGCNVREECLQCTGGVIYVHEECLQCTGDVMYMRSVRSVQGI